MQSSEQNKQVSLLYNWDSRNAGNDSYDTRFENALAEPIGQEYFQIVKRDGSSKITLPDGDHTSSVLLGFYYWSSATANPILACVFWNTSTTVLQNINYTVNILDGTLSVLSTNTMGSGLVGVGLKTNITFQEYLFDDGHINLYMGGPTANQVWQLTSAGVLTTFNSATGTGGSLVFMDGYLFRGSTQDIFNSNLNDPTTWSASNFISVESYADQLIEIARVGSYIVAFSQDSIQYFYDAANPTGSPLSVVQGATKKIGYLGGLAPKGDEVYFVGSEGGAASLYKLNGLKATPVVSFPFARMWSAYGGLIQTPLRGRIVSMNGHTCYYIEAAGQGDNNVQTYMYDLDGEQWIRLSYQATTNMWITSSQTFALATGFRRECYFSLYNDGNLYKFNSTVYQDNGVNFTVTFRTPLMDFGSRRTKFGESLKLNGDMTSATSYANISWTDNDYQTFSTPRQVDLSKSYQQLWALGSFRARSFVLTYSDNFPMRFKTIELDYDIGTA